MKAFCLYIGKFAIKPIGNKNWTMKANESGDRTAGIDKRNVYIYI